ncbi:MAG: hypothetical protein A3D64_01605 [Candidatus Wildermuthbacteria bacterium RIFCSPHIGHO2_02_FULL_49_9]|uniref:Uncharacterized protein n=1 Tax=Candidatus Wildermuthbacteria bacterium RIFCSPHIGHO2_02_FULL_49_9 TaxID=1802456 RepID=A0A1G2RCF3_9BACT|nr:MAG: hypothetical protein A3D64_01605 [Candidatus Wildermuthbacteria bacterium RIFCSPHIGHO2_02_FULL_49_9]
MLKRRILILTQKGGESMACNMVGVIGPTDISQLAQFLGRSQEILVERGALVGQILAETGKELLVTADGGMLQAVAESYKDHGGEKLVMLLPLPGDLWSIEHAEPYAVIADEVRRPADWIRANLEVVSTPELCVCVGLSAGTMAELSYIRWNIELGGGNLQTLIAIRELLRGGEVPPEYKSALAPVLRYTQAVEGLREVLKEYQLSCAGMPL